MSQPLLLFISLTEPVLCALRVNSVISSFFSVSLTSCNINYNLVGSMCEWKPLFNTLEITDLETAHTKRNFERIVSNSSIQYSFKTRDGKGQFSERPWKPRVFFIYPILAFIAFPFFINITYLDNVILCSYLHGFDDWFHSNLQMNVKNWVDRKQDLNL